MPLLRRFTALILLLSVITTVCEGCVPDAIADTCCPEPCHECACYDAQPVDQPPAAAPIGVEWRADAHALPKADAATAPYPRSEASGRALQGRTAPAEPPRLSMLSVYRI